ncbi:hypothetical protein HZ326_31871 [Fusarium oxysporum f. sp. albedinis]|nr:hypothetical protein HZ326_31871 [Fusarium oxysporum f. sp. albedinis]
MAAIAAAPKLEMQLWSCAKLGADIIRTPTRAEVERRLGVSLWGPNFVSRMTNPSAANSILRLANDINTLRFATCWEWEEWITWHREYRKASVLTA